MTDVSIIIVNYNTLSMTLECINSVFEKTKDISFEVILVDNASNDDSKEFFEKDSRIRYIYNEENLGFGRANNIGIKESKGRNVFFLNSDTLLLNNAIKILSDYLDDNEKVGICGGNLFDKDMQPIHSYQMYFPSIKEEVNELLNCLPTAILRKDRSQFNFTNEPKPVAYITGADLMVKKSLLNKYGGFNPAFFMYFEETELCYRIKKVGYQIVSVPESKIVHLCGKSTNSSKKSEMYYESKRLFYNITHNNKLLNKLFSLLVTRYN